MRYLTRYALLAIGVLTTSVGGWARAPQAETPQAHASLAPTPRAQPPQARLPRATVRELATLEGELNGFVSLPGGTAVIYTVSGGSAPSQRIENSTFTYEIATKRRTLLGTNMLPSSVSPAGDRLAFSRSAEDGAGDFLWTLPIDPETGAATGAAQRVSLRTIGGRALFSPDGRMLVFSAGPRPDGTWDVALVAATGGAERVVANYTEGGLQTWSADGKSLYVQRYRFDDPQTAIERVPVAGGRSEPAVSRSLFTDRNALGLSPDARVAFFQSNPDRFFYRAASGVEGEIAVPLPALDDGWGYNLTLDATMRYVTMTQDRQERVRVLDVASAETRDLLPASLQSSTPAWSPDGRRIAVLNGNLSHYDITVVDADGSSPRHYPVPLHLDGWFGQTPDHLVWEKPWSPDGRFLAFRANLAQEGQRVGWSHQDQHQIGLLDVDSGETRVLITSSALIGRFVWRSDGNAVRAVERRGAWMGSPSGLTIIEIPLNGQGRMVRDISAEFANVNDIVFLSDDAVVVTVAAAQTMERFLVPLDGGAARRLPDLSSERGLRAGPGLVAGTRMLFTYIDERREAQFIKVVSTEDDSTRTLRLPFSSAAAVAFPDGERVASIGKAPGDSVWKLFLVPLDGSVPRLAGEIPWNLSAIGGVLAPSPDGRSIAYSSHGPYTSTILEIDFAPAFEAIVRR